jgi:pyridinium-3,5-biscarboxylic acid mononucleotide sulfurtransferase
MNGLAFAGGSPQASAIRLERRIRSYGAPHAVVAVSGGVDSSVVLALAARALGAAAVTAVTALSPSYPAGELEDARSCARYLGVAHETMITHEVEMERYAQNGPLRCFFCKAELYSSLHSLARHFAGAARVVLAGANFDDTGDFRPGLLAARRYGVRNPLLEEGVGKASVRALARYLQLPAPEKPALACLSSRVDYGIRITPELLARIDQAEQLVKARGFQSVRVRHFGNLATIEVPREDLQRLAADPQLPQLLADLRRLGWRQVVLDPAGLRSGRMNATLQLKPSLQRSIDRLRDPSADSPASRPLS